MKERHIPGNETGANNIGIAKRSSVKPLTEEDLSIALSGASSETIGKLLKLYRDEADRHSCSMPRIEEERQELELIKGQIAAYGEMAKIALNGASFGLTLAMQAGLCKCLEDECPAYLTPMEGKIGNGADSMDGAPPTEHYEKGMERGYRHIIYQLEKVHNDRLGLERLENMKKAVRSPEARRIPI
jgi:hypothetical protein